MKFSHAQTLEVHRIIQHPRYGKGAISSDYDFALMELKEDATFDSVSLNEQEIDIPETEETSPESITAGWGTLQESGNTPSVLQKVSVPLVSHANCTRSYPGKISDQMICAGLKIGGKDSCQGDSGGPLLLQDNSGHPVLIGVVSWGAGCARPNKYGVYSKVNSVTSWIQTTVRSSR